jgi:DNA-binding GntR family transcriptional regulator
MPSENGLAERFSISRMTVRRAFDTLVHAGLVVRRQGRGTFVAPETTRQADGGLIGFIGQSLMTGISSELVAHLNGAIEARKLAGWHLLVCGAQTVRFAHRTMSPQEKWARVDGIPR